jgi:hypothetical protein
MRYGPKRIAAALGVLAMITLSSFAVKNYFDKQNNTVLKSIHQQSMVLADDPKVTIANKVKLIAEEMRLGLATVDETIDAIKDPVQKINISSGIATTLVFKGMGKPVKETFKAISISDSILESITFPKDDPVLTTAVLKEINDLRATLELAYNYNADPKIDEWLNKNARRSAKWVLHILETQPSGFQNMQELHIALENAINYHIFSATEIDKLHLLHPGCNQTTCRTKS